jgi:hypothetical protein
MTKTYYLQWDWEFDRGIGRLSPTDDGLPGSYAVAYFDIWGRLYRVHRYENSTLADAYDYYCDDSGRTLEKRSIYRAVDGDVCVIVRYSYDLEQKTITETAWWPDSDEPSKSIVRKLQ